MDIYYLCYAVRSLHNIIFMYCIVNLVKIFYNRFGLLDHKVHNENLRNITTELYSGLIPTFADRLNDNYYGEPSMYPESFVLSNWLHGQGINCRHLGLVLLHSTCIQWKRVLLTEMVARCLKIQIRKALRDRSLKEISSLLSSLPPRQLVTKILNPYLIYYPAAEKLPSFRYIEEKHSRGK